MDEYIVYVKINESNYIISINSSVFLSDTSEWIEIDRGSGDKYHHAQGNYFENIIITESGAYRYKLVDGKPEECSEEEIREQEEALKPVVTLEGLKEEKLASLSVACEEAINNGASVKLSNGQTKSFSYNIKDQNNISEMFNAVQMGATAYPYHADDEGCEIYSAEDIILIYTTLSGLKTMQTTYYNQLKQYVQSLNDAQEIMEVQYGQELTGEYLEHYNSLIQIAQEQIQVILGSINNAK